MLCERNITDGLTLMCSVLNLLIGNSHGMSYVGLGKGLLHLLPACKMCLLDGPSPSVIDLQRILGHGTTLAGLVAGTNIQLKLGLQPKPLGVARKGHDWRSAFA